MAYLIYPLVALLILLPYLSSAAVPGDYPSQVEDGGKTGLAWSTGNSANVKQFLSTGKVSWYYTWNPDAIGGADKIDFVPMLWGAKQVGDWEHSINSTIRNHHVTHVLGFNEPDNSGQSHLSPAQAATLWRAHIEPLKKRGIRLGSPAPTGSPQGKQWLQQFLQACKGCSIDFVAMHFYITDAQTFIENVKEWHNTFKRPIWVTEWACQDFGGGKQCTQSQVTNFMDKTRDFMDKTDYVARYAWMGPLRDMGDLNPANALENKQGQITDLGKKYIGAGKGSQNTEDETSGEIMSDYLKVTLQGLWATFWSGL